MAVIYKPSLRGHFSCRGNLFIIAILFLLFSPSCFAKESHKPFSNIIGQVKLYKVQDEETLYDIARKFDLGIDELVDANADIDPWLLEKGQLLVIPSMYILPTVPYQGIVINKADLRLYFFPQSVNLLNVLTLPISIGVTGFDTPLGETIIIKKKKDPSWVPPPSIRAEHPDLPLLVKAGPDNPMGKYALYLKWPGIAIHGTNKPWSIGTYGSHGCIRLYPEDIEKLFKVVREQEKVVVVDEPIKIGYFGNAMYLEATFSDDERLQKELFTTVVFKDDFSKVKKRIKEQAKYYNFKIDWKKVDTILNERKGVPYIISK